MILLIASALALIWLVAFVVVFALCRAAASGDEQFASAFEASELRGSEAQELPL